MKYMKSNKRNSNSQENIKNNDIEREKNVTPQNHKISPEKNITQSSTGNHTSHNTRENNFKDQEIKNPWQFYVTV